MDVNLNEKIFNYSLERLEKQRKSKLLLLFVVDSAFLCIFGLIFIKLKGSTPPSAGIFLLTGAVLVALTGAAGIIAMKRVFKGLLNLKLRISLDAIERFTPNSSEKIAFKDLKKLVIVKSGDEKVRYIDLATEKSVLGIYGFENMEEISGIIKSHASANTQVIERKPLINWEDPKVIIAYVVIIMLVMVFGFDFWTKINYTWRNALIGGFWLFYGLCFIKFRLASKYSGSRFRRFEVILGSLMVILGLISIIFIGRR